MAFVVIRDPKKKEGFEGRLKAHAKERLPGFACPEWVLIVDELPVSGLCLVVRRPGAKYQETSRSLVYTLIWSGGALAGTVSLRHASRPWSTIDEACLLANLILISHPDRKLPRERF